MISFQEVAFNDYDHGLLKWSNTSHISWASNRPPAAARHPSHQEYVNPFSTGFFKAIFIIYVKLIIIQTKLLKTMQTEYRMKDENFG